MNKDPNAPAAAPAPGEPAMRVDFKFGIGQAGRDAPGVVGRITHATVDSSHVVSYWIQYLGGDGVAHELNVLERDIVQRFADQAGQPGHA